MTKRSVTKRSVSNEATAVVAKPATPGTGSKLKDREEWLTKLTKKLRPIFKEAGYELPDKIRLTCGFPSRQALAKNRRVGECWHQEASDDHTHEISITPLVDDSLEVAAIAAHELSHTLFPPGTKHRQPFQRVCDAIGLLPPYPSTTASPALVKVLRDIVATIGEYPHAKLNHDRAPKKNDKCRFLKVVCGECGYTLRTTKKWIMVGLPTCCCGGEMVCDPPLEEIDEDDTDEADDE